MRPPEILDRELRTVPEEEVPAARVEYTVVGGAVRYERNATPAAR